MKVRNIIILNVANCIFHASFQKISFLSQKGISHTSCIFTCLGSGISIYLYSTSFTKSRYLSRSIIFHKTLYLYILYVFQHKQSLILAFPAHIDFTGPWELAMPTCWLMKRSTAQHGGTHMKRQHRMSRTIIIIYFLNVYFFHARLGLDIFPDMRPLHIYLNTAHSGCKPSSTISSFTHSLQVFLPLPTHLTPPPPHFYRPTSNHLHSYIPHAQTTLIYHASPPQLRSEHPKDCTRPHFSSYPSETHHTSISP